ncbi:MAG TPA: hypothetical protein VFD84_05165 [Candidatus Binatia bacterium]|nr:hypothetical protein [Candidatus Binatia bacterium]
MRTSALVAAAALALAVLAPRAARAFDVKVWPLFRYASSGDTVRWSALGPFVEFTRTGERRDLRIRPVLWLTQRRGPVPDDRAEILFPIASSRWEEGYRSFRLLLFTYRTSPEPGTPHAPGALPPPELWGSRFTLFPLVWYRHRPAERPRFSFLPFYLDLDDVLGFDNVHAVLFPAYLRLRQPRVERRYFGFFVSTVGGPDGRGFRVFPFWGTKEIVGRERTRYVLWPFHIRSDVFVPGWGWEHRRVDLPFVSAIDGPARTSRAYGLFAHTHTVDRRRNEEAIGAPWPLYYRARRLGEERHHVWRLVPIYGRSDTGGVSSRFYAWPAYRTKAQDVDDFHYRRDDVMLFAWRRQRLESADTGRRESLVTVLGALRSERENARRFGQTPALADSILPKNRGVLALWAPLSGVFRWDTAPDGSREWNLLWGLVARERGHLRGPIHVDLGDGDGG